MLQVTSPGPQVVIFGCGMDARTWRLPEASSADVPSPEASSSNESAGASCTAQVADTVPLVETVFEVRKRNVLAVQNSNCGLDHSPRKLLVPQDLFAWGSTHLRYY